MNISATRAALHGHAADGRMRCALGLSGVRLVCAARDPDGAALRDDAGLDAARPCGERAKRSRAAHAGVAQGVARRGMRLLFREVVPRDPPRHGWFQELFLPAGHG